MLQRFIAALTPAALLLPSLAAAHDGLHEASFSGGLAHPFSGLDHALAALAVGLLAGRLQTRRAWLIPLAFVLTMTGGAAGLASISIPFTEIMIALSVIALGLAVAAPNTLGLTAAAVLVAFFALFHGYAHGFEANRANAAGYIAGLALATALLHAVGAFVALGLRGYAVRHELTLRTLGRVVMIAGVVIAVRLI